MEMWELTWVEFKSAVKAGQRIAYLPVGTIEAHGKHLPLGTDILIPIKIAEHLASKLGGFVAPPLYYGVTRSLIAYPGSLILTPSTFKALVEEVLCSLAAKGVGAVVVINGHGGNTEHIKTAARSAYAKSGVRTVLVNWWQYAAPVSEKYYGKSAGHALADETAAMLAVEPSLVKRELFDKEDRVTFVRGVWAFPSPASAIAYSEGEPEVDLDEGRASSFFSEVLARVEAVVSDLLTKMRALPCQR